MIVKNGADDTTDPAAEPHLRLPLAGSFGLKDAKDVCESLRKALSTSGLVEIDVTGLAGHDISLIQLLIAARKSAERRGITLALMTAPDGALQVTLARAGLLDPDGDTDDPFWGVGAPSAGEAAA